MHTFYIRFDLLFRHIFQTFHKVDRELESHVCHWCCSTVWDPKLSSDTSP